MSQICCPRCGSNAYKRNGYTRHAKQNHRCLNCGRQFSSENTDLNLNEDQGKMVDQQDYKVCSFG